MVWLDIFNNNLLLVAETLAIVIGSILMGILLSYLYWSGLKRKVSDATNDLAQEREQTEDLKVQLKQQAIIKQQLQTEISDHRLKLDAQSKKIFDQQQHLFDQKEQLNQLDALSKNQKASLDELHKTIDHYQKRLKVIEEESFKAKKVLTPVKKVNAIPAVRANYEHVSKLLGRQVTENDLTLIVGIGPKTATLLQSKGIKTWDALSKASADKLRKILADAGGIYKSLDSTHWPKQAIMAAKSEWRKLRVFQETLRKSE